MEKTTPGGVLAAGSAGSGRDGRNGAREGAGVQIRQGRRGTWGRAHSGEGLGAGEAGEQRHVEGLGGPARKLWRSRDTAGTGVGVAGSRRGASAQSSGGRVRRTER